MLNTSHRCLYRNYEQQTDATSYMSKHQYSAKTCFFVSWPSKGWSNKILILDINKMLSRSDRMYICCLNTLVYDQIFCTNKVLQWMTIKKKLVRKGNPKVLLLWHLSNHRATQCWMSYLSLGNNYILRESFQRTRIYGSKNLRKTYTKYK